MDGRTHAIVGATTAVAVTQPKTVSSFLFVAATGAAGGLFCDVDSRLSKGSKMLNKIIMGITSIAVLAIAGSFLAPDLTKSLWENYGISNRVLVGSCLMIIAALVGSHTPHRRVTHSVEYTLIVGVFASIISPMFGIAILVGMVSHIVLDCFNKKPVRVSLLLRFSICFNLCSSFSKTSNLIAGLAMFMLIGYPVMLFI